MDKTVIFTDDEIKILLQMVCYRYSTIVEFDEDETLLLSVIKKLRSVSFEIGH